MATTEQRLRCQLFSARKRHDRISSRLQGKARFPPRDLHGDTLSNLFRDTSLLFDSTATKFGRHHSHRTGSVQHLSCQESGMYLCYFEVALALMSARFDEDTRYMMEQA
jgi:hypothetical protein